jgi:Ser-tRNA(Ala) deacylase AlaX
MKKIFWESPYQTELETEVVTADDCKVLFESTIAYSFSGGQESDKAFVNGMPILGSQMENNLAAELILEIVTRRYELTKVGAHIAEHKARIDFACKDELKPSLGLTPDQNLSALFPAILAEYNAIIDEDHPIECDFSNIEKQRRYWSITGFAKVPCGGTHVRSTKEVGYINLKRERPKKFVERVVITLEHDSNVGLTLK